MTLPAELRAEATYLRSLIPEAVYTERRESLARQADLYDRAADALEWPARFGCNGPEGTFWTDDSELANKLIAATYDRDDWTVTDMRNPLPATPEGG